MALPRLESVGRLRLRAALLGVCAVQACDGDPPATAVIDPPPVVIGPAGGSIAMASGTARLVIPPGALLSDTEVSVEALASAPPDANLVGPTAHRFEPGSQLLAIAATLELSYELATLGDRPESALRIARWNGAAWEPQVARQVVDSLARVVSSSVTALGDFAIVRDPCVPARVNLSEPIVGVTTRTDCPAPTGPPFNSIRWNDYFDVTLSGQSALGLGVEANFYAVAGIQHYDAAPSAGARVARAFLPTHIPAGPQRNIRAILAPGRYQFFIGEYDSGLGGTYTLTPTPRTVAEVTRGFPCVDPGVYLVPGVTIGSTVSDADCRYVILPGSTSDPGAINATSHWHAFVVSLRAGDTATVTLTGNTAAANVGLVVRLGPGTMLHRDEPDITTREVTLAAGAEATGYSLWVRVHGRSANGYAFPGPSAYTLTVTRQAAAPAAAPHPSR